MGFLVFFAAFVLAAAVHVVGQPGFLSIDCGLDSNYSGYKDGITGIFYVSDGPYVDAGENHKVAPELESHWSRALVTLRSFPSGVRNCYTLPTDGGTKYLLRLWFVYGNYDGKNSSSLQFDLHLGTNLWETVYLGNNNDRYEYDEEYAREAVFVAWASWAPVCLVNTGGGTPFVSSVELRALGDALYPPVTPKQSLAMLYRFDMGSNPYYTRYPDDRYDRWWQPMASRPSPQWANLSTTSSVQPDASFAEPLPVLQTAVAATGNDTALTAYTWQDTSFYEYMVFLHFADFQNSQLRQFDAYLNGNRLGPSDHPYSPPYLAASCVYSSNWYRSATDGWYNVTLVATAASVLPPMLNAIEIYWRIDHDTPTTFPKDYESSLSIFGGDARKRDFGPVWLV